MNRHTMILLCTAFVLASPVSADVFTFTGAATSLNGSALYEERHSIEGSCDSGVFQPVGHQVTYIRKVEGAAEAFAKKTLDYSHSNIRPGVSYQQPDFQESLDISYGDSGSVNVVWQQPGGDKKRSSVEVSDNLVVDAGFDNLVRQNWDKIVSGESVRFRFLAPTRGEEYAFILEPAQSQLVSADHLVQIRPDSVLLKFLVDPIVLGYNNKGALTAYSGLTNVRENPEQNYTATIRYTVSTYPECELTP